MKPKIEETPEQRQERQHREMEEAREASEQMMLREYRAYGEKPSQYTIGGKQYTMSRELRDLLKERRNAEN